MLIAIIGESCVGKSTLAEALKKEIQAEVYTGRDYLRLAKNEAIAKKQFQTKLSGAVEGENLIYVISEAEHLALLPEGALRILMTADLELILERFTVRMRGTLPPPVKQMLQKKHGQFDGVPCQYRIHNGENIAALMKELLKK